MTQEGLLLSIPQVRARLGGLGRGSVYRLMSEGELQRVKIGKRAFVTAESVESYVKRISRGERD